jgi:hypothetical protein
VVEWSKRWNIKINEDKAQAIYFSQSVKQGSPHHWKVSKVRTGLRIA